MGVEANRTVKLPLRVPTDRVEDLHETRSQYQHCQNTAADFCWDDPKQPDDLITTKGTVEDALYDSLKDETDLQANLVQKSFKDVVDAMSSLKTAWENDDRISKPDWNERADGSYAMTYDKRAATYKTREATFATVNGTVDCQYELPADIEGTPYEQYVLNPEWSFSTSKLVYDGERFWLHAAMKRNYADDGQARDSDTHNENPVRVLGVDLNVKGHSAVTSAGEFHGNADQLNHRRSEYEALRGDLQETGTRSAHLRLKHRTGTEWSWFDQYAHEVANGVVSDARRVNATHVVMEDLTRIRERISDEPEYQQWMFDRIQEYVEYKLEPFGIEFATVDPRYTSQACSRTDCECVMEANRSGKQFKCCACGYELDADLNAAKNIAFNYLAESVPASRTCSSGKATSQLALVSGTLSPAGEFSRQEWPSTDKLHPQQSEQVAVSD